MTRTVNFASQERGVHYRPFLNSRMPSLGITFAAPGRITPRRYHLLSRLEFHTFLILQRQEEVADVLEQFPLPIEATLAVASALGVRHPMLRSGGAAVMSTDFVVVQRGRPSAYAVKPVDVLAKARTREKLRIERDYWHGLGAEWYLVTDSAIPGDLADNLFALDGEWDCPEVIGPEYLDLLRLHLEDALRQPVEPLFRVCLAFDEAAGMTRGAALRGVVHLISREVLLTDLRVRFEPGWVYSLRDRLLTRERRA